MIALRRILGAIAALLFGPLLGIVVGFVVSGFVLPPDPSFDTNGGHASPGDGFLIITSCFLSLVFTVPLSILGAGLVLFWPVKNETHFKMEGTKLESSPISS